jgi:hypothetical protein
VTLNTLRFLRDLLGKQQISAETPDLVGLASTVSEVRKELDMAIREAEQ